MSRTSGMRGVALLMLILAVLPGCAGSAFAHASLLRSSPADGGVIAAPPDRFELTFNEPVSPLVLKLVTPGSGSVALTAYAVRGETLSIAAPSGLTSGTYALSWRVVSTDGHPIGGTLVFSIGAPSAGAVPDIADVVDWPLRVAIWTAKLVLYAGLFIGIGGVFFLRWIGDAGRGVERLIAATMLLGLVAAVSSLGLQGVDALDAGLATLGQSIVWRTGFATSYGFTVSIAACALAAGLIALRPRGAAGRAGSALALIGIGAALAASGHASAASPQWLTRCAVFLHGVGIAVWAGALMPLSAVLARPDAKARETLARFSRLAPYAVLPLIAAGFVLAVVQLQSLDALWTTAYGRVFLVKSALLMPLFALAAANRFLLTQPATQGDPAGAALLRRFIAGETLLVLAIFGAAACWRFTPPPRALAKAAAEPAAIHIHTGKAMADLTIAPGRAGLTTASMIIMTGDFGPLPAKEVTLTLANPAAGIEPITRPAMQPGDGTWQVPGLLIPAPGRWSVRIDILVTDFDIARLDGEIDIRD